MSLKKDTNSQVPSNKTHPASRPHTHTRRLSSGSIELRAYMMAIYNYVFGLRFVHMFESVCIFM